MDLCSDIMAAHLELRGRGLHSRRDRVALMRSQGGDQSGAEVTENPMQVQRKKQNAQSDGVELVETGGTSTSDSGAGDEDKATLTVLLLWFTVALGNMAAWTAMMSILGPFKLKFGDSIFLKMNAAYYGPALPVLLCQIHFSPWLDRKLGSYRGYVVRGVLPCLVLVLLMAFFPTAMAAGGGEAWILICSFAIGVFGGVSYGTIFSFNALFSKSCASVFCMGLFGPGFAFLFFHLAIGFSPPPADQWKVDAHWFLGAVLSALGLVAFLILLNQPSSRKLIDEADRQRRLEDERKKNSEETAELVPAKPVATKEVATLIWISLGSIFLSIFAIVSITSFFTAVESDGMLGKSMTVTLFYIKNSSDFFGRCLTLLPMAIKTQRAVGLAVLARFILVPIFFWFVLQPVKSDILMCALIATSGLTSGYLNTACFVIAGRSIAKQVKAKAAGLMNLSFQAALLVSIGFGFVLVAARS